VIRDESFVTKLADIGLPISAALKSGESLVMLSVASLDDQVAFTIQRRGGDDLGTSVTFTRTPVSEPRMKIIFEKLRLPVPRESEDPKDFFKGQPVQLIYRIEAARMEARELATIASAIFKDFCGFEPDSDVRVNFFEFRGASKGK